MITTILLVFSFVLFTIAAIWSPAAPSPWFGKLVAAGLACMALSMLLAGSALHLH